jgi:hypothetical protein
MASAVATASQPRPTSWYKVDIIFEIQWNRGLLQDQKICTASIWSASEGATPELKNFPNMIYRWTRRLASAIIVSSNSEKRMFENQKCVNAMLKFISM